MANCIIHPIPLFRSGGDKSMMTYLANFGQQITLLRYVWYIEGTKEKILVDASGVVEEDTMGGKAGDEEIQTLDSGLSKLGLSVDDIEIIILTHLHLDHVTAAFRFPRARFLVQRDELEFAQNPHPAVADFYNKQLLNGLNLEVISGDAEICDGVSVISTPGHSPGNQSVSIKTAQGIAIIAGFCSIWENFEPPPPVSKTMPVIAPGVHDNLFDAYDSVLKVKEMADIVVPLHDPVYWQKTSIP